MVFGSDNEVLRGVVGITRFDECNVLDKTAASEMIEHTAFSSQKILKIVTSAIEYAFEAGRRVAAPTAHIVSGIVIESDIVAENVIAGHGSSRCGEVCVASYYLGDERGVQRISLVCRIEIDSHTFAVSYARGGIEFCGGDNVGGGKSRSRAGSRLDGDNVVFDSGYTVSGTEFDIVSSVSGEIDGFKNDGNGKFFAHGRIDRAGSYYYDRGVGFDRAYGENAGSRVDGNAVNGFFQSKRRVGSGEGHGAADVNFVIGSGKTYRSTNGFLSVEVYGVVFIGDVRRIPTGDDVFGRESRKHRVGRSVTRSQPVNTTGLVLT